MKPVLPALLLATLLVGCAAHTEPAPASEAAPPAAPLETPAETPAPADASGLGPSDAAHPDSGTETAPPSAAESDALSAVRAAAQAANCPLAVAYVGFDFDVLSPDFDPTAVAAAYPCGGDPAYVDALGYEVYVLIPAESDAALTIGRVELSDAGELVPTGETLYAGGGAPVILRCNVSDIMPNVLVTVTGSDGGVYTGSPTLSLRDGSVWMEGAYDFTHYPAGMEREG